MPSQLTRSQLEAQRRLRRFVASHIERAWRSLPDYEDNRQAQFLQAVIPVVVAAQRQSATVTDAYIARVMRRAPIGVPPGVISNLRGVSPEEVYTRPFKTLWTALGNGSLYDDAFSLALNRAMGTATADVQMAMRAASDYIEGADDNIYGYTRVANADACEFCSEVDGAYVKASDGFAFALHNNCGCSLEPNTEPHRGAVTLPDGTRVREFQYGALNDRVAVRQHGELGPILGSPDHDFTEL